MKKDAPLLLRRQLSSPRWKPETVVMSGVTDCYQPVERRLKLTRGCLEVLRDFRNPVSIITKNHLVTRDSDLLSDLAGDRAAAVFVSVTTLDGRLAGQLEPRASHPKARLAAIEHLVRAGVPVGASVAPVIPGLTDHEIPRILEAVARAGARWAHYTIVRLPYSVAPLFEEWLTRHVSPAQKKKVLNHIREVRGGRVNDHAFGSRMSGQGIIAEQIALLFEVAARKVGLNATTLELSAAAFRRPDNSSQLSLF